MNKAVRLAMKKDSFGLGSNLAFIFCSLSGPRFGTVVHQADPIRETHFGQEVLPVPVTILCAYQRFSDCTMCTGMGQGPMKSLLRVPVSGSMPRHIDAMRLEAAIQQSKEV